MIPELRSCSATPMRSPLVTSCDVKNQRKFQTFTSHTEENGVMPCVLTFDLFSIQLYSCGENWEYEILLR